MEIKDFLIGFAAGKAQGGGGDPTIVSWASGTDEQISAMIEAAHAGKIDLQTDGGWAVGDVRSITIEAFTAGGNVSVEQQNIDIVISQFGDYENCGAVMQFDFKDELSSGVRFHSSDSNSGGYGSSEIKNTTLPALVNALPNWLKQSLIEFSCKASAGSKDATIQTITGNKLALRSEVEIFGSTSWSFPGEGSQVAYYSESANRIKKRGHSGVDSIWWERSPRSTSFSSYCIVLANGTSDNLNADYVNCGVAPFGCL